MLSFLSDLQILLVLNIFIYYILKCFLVELLAGNLVQVLPHGDVNDVINNLYQVLVTVWTTLETKCCNFLSRCYCSHFMDIGTEIWGYSKQTAHKVHR